jgi:hypothetical protein
VAAVPDTDGGALDGNGRWDRAIGPMQFIPSTWRIYAADGNHDGVEDPQNIYDATLAAANYLCATGPELNQPHQLIRAVYAYNHSYSYVRDVLTVAAHYEHIRPGRLIDHLPGAKRRLLAMSFTAPPPGASSAASPTPTPTHSADPTPTPSPSPTPSRSPSPSPSPTPTPTASHAPTPRPTSSQGPIRP